ncbi:NACHT domain-containing protein [Verminephrobacter aporrectodeae]|uniref:NACHT domain-containing protein n=1 Tax=Verminephrobacter aporrectodeae TaxID=1110389 RepID=UPI002244999F|nr:hypothetical protein [Verminephrobacter aporrectodeae]
MTPEQRKSPGNGIWLCQNHGKAVDTGDRIYTVELLRKWKAQAEQYSWRCVLHGNTPQGLANKLSPSEDELRNRLRAATVGDLDVFRQSAKWPSSGIALTLKVDGLSDPVSTSALATALTTFGDLILVAPPGMGKTATLFQVAEAALTNGGGLPIIVPLGAWSTDSVSLLGSILKRPAFREISEDDLRGVAAKPGVILLLDGWNELDGEARRRATVQIERLQQELPEISLLVSTRKQALDIPVHGTRINLLPLNEGQQIDIARALHGDAGERIVDHAWRTAGVRELVTIPLYLTALLSLAEATPFPTTKEEVLRRFVTVFEKDHQHVEALAQVTHGLHQRFLDGLAATATRAMNTTLAETAARKSIADTDNTLVEEGQITDKPQPAAVLEVLVSHHVLMCVGDPAGYSFQHQQFQEWYASHIVEDMMLKSDDDDISREMLKADILNQPVWEEAILFACERQSRGSQSQQKACGAVILIAFSVDPLLAAEMICRSTDAVWMHVSTDIQSLVGRWHRPGEVDRALRFMIGSGRPEFLDQVWSLIAHESRQVRLEALHARYFHSSSFGGEAAKRIAAQPPEVREDILRGIVFDSGMDGLDLVASVAKADPDSNVKAKVIEAFAFRRADRHVADMLQGADDKVFDLLARDRRIDDVADEAAKLGLAAARERMHKGPRDQLYSLMESGHSNDDRNVELITFIAKMDLQENAFIGEPLSRFPGAVAEGILCRVREGRTLPHDTQRWMAGSGFAFEDDALLDIALEMGMRHNPRANAAASVLGPQAVGRMIERMFEAKKLACDAGGKSDQDAGNRYHAIRKRIWDTQIAALLTAVMARSPHADNQEMGELAELISCYPDGNDMRKKQFNDTALTAVAKFAEDWGKRLLNSPDATRAQLASIATLVSHSPSVNLLPLLKRLLDEDLRRWRAFKEQARANLYRRGIADREAGMSWTLQYQRAFHAISSSETTTLMREYLPDEDFGESAAWVLVEQWHAANEPSDSRHGVGRPYFFRVAEKRAARASNPTLSSAPADAIFNAIGQLISQDATETMKKHAVTLAIVAVELPHGQRDGMIKKLLAIADRGSRCRLLKNLFFSGEIIGVDLVMQGIADVFEAARTQVQKPAWPQAWTEAWILTEQGELPDWLCLLPFTNRPADVFDVVRVLPRQHRMQDLLIKTRVLDAFGAAPGVDAENALFQFAEAYPYFYRHPAWRDAVIRRGTLSAAKRMVNLAAQGTFNDNCDMALHLASLMGKYDELRTYVHDLLKKAPSPAGLAVLARAVAENLDVDSLLLLIQSEIMHKCTLVPRHMIRSVVTKDVPVEDWKGAYNVVATPAAELRRNLLAMVTDGGPTDVAARYLNFIDEFRDEYGTPESGPRHPDLASGKAWPIMVLGPSANETG